jgi:hypothetical protein
MDAENVAISSWIAALCISAVAVLDKSKTQKVSSGGCILAQRPCCDFAVLKAEINSVCKRGMGCTDLQ